MFARIISAPAARRSSGASPVTVARVPTGMNAGVETSPREVITVPRRARVSTSRRPGRKAKVMRGRAGAGIYHAEAAGAPAAGRGGGAAGRRTGGVVRSVRGGYEGGMSLVIRLYSDFV